MNQSIKAVLALIVIGSVLFAIIGWLPTDVDPDSFVFWARIVCPILAVLCLVPLIWAQTRKDKAPNFLVRVSPRYFERDGFCFAVVPSVSNNRCSMQVYFQNRYSGPCRANVLIRASSGLFSGKPNLSDIRLGISCGPAEFGCSTIAWAIPEHLQGQKIALSLYASANYPNGRGALLRYQDGLRVGSLGADVWREGLQIAAAVTGSLVISRSARISFILPKGVDGAIQETIAVDTKILWRLGEPT